MSGPETLRAGAVRATPAPPPTQGRSVGLDPRTKILLVLLVSIAVMGANGARFVLPGLVLAVSLALLERAWRRAWLLPVLVGAVWLAGWTLSHTPASPITALVLLTCAYALRLVVVLGVGLHFFSTTSPTALNAALRALRAPRAVAVTLVVMFRFFPLVLAESAAVLDALRLRGLLGPGVLVHHPVLVLERFTVPMIASSLRASQDLSAASILRGLGSLHRPTSLVPLRLTWVDGVWLLLTAVLAVTATAVPLGL